MESWCEAEACLYRKRLRPEEAAGNRMVHELQLVLLKNISQAVANDRGNGSKDTAKTRQSERRTA